MKKTLFIGLALAASCAARAQDVPQSSNVVASLWMPQGQGASVAQVPSSFAVNGGSAPIERALVSIIPNPYIVKLDARVPTNLMMTWSASSDWMTALHKACAALGLEVRPDWSTNTIEVKIDPHSRQGRLLLSQPTQAALASAGAAAVMAQQVPAAAPSSAEVHRVVGALVPGWYQMIHPGHEKSLDAAILDLLPASMPSANVEISAINDSQEVSWPRATRLNALKAVLAQIHGVAYLTSSSVRVVPQNSLAAAYTPAAQALAQSAATKPAPAQPMVSTPAPAPVEPSYVLRPGVSIESQFFAWAKLSNPHWEILYSLPHNWIVPGAVDFGHDFVKAITTAVRTMAANGADARIHVLRGDHVVLIYPAGANPGANK